MSKEDGQGVGKAHHNRNPRRGPQCSWLTKLPDIVYRIGQSSEMWFDRKSIEVLFDLRRNSACKLMRQVGAGPKDRLVSRRDLLMFVFRVQQSPEYYREVSRRAKLSDKLGAAARDLAARQIAIPMPSPAPDAMSGLSPGVLLTPGRLVIEFKGTEDLLRKLYELSQASARDFIAFQKAVEG